MIKVDTFSKSSRGVVTEMNCCEDGGDVFLLLTPLSIDVVYELQLQNRERKSKL